MIFSVGSGIRNQHYPGSVGSKFNENYDAGNLSQLPTRASIDTADEKPVQRAHRVMSTPLSAAQKQILSLLPQLEQWMENYLEYRTDYHPRLSKLIVSMNLREIKPSLQMYFREASLLKNIVPDWQIFEVLALHAEQEIRSKLNAFSRKLWAM